MGLFGELSGGKTPSTSNKKYWGGKVPWITSKDVKMGTIISTSRCLTEEGASLLKTYPSGSIVFVMRSGILKHTFPVAMLGIDSTVNQDIKVLIPNAYVDNHYLYHSIVSREQFILNACSKNGTTVESIDDEKLKSVLMPLPPLSEQKRIVIAISNYLKIAIAHSHLSRSSMAFIKNIRDSIVACAIQGKIVSQRETEPPIHLENSTILRRDNSYYEVINGKERCIDDEIPFEIPESWRWCRMKDVSNYGTNVSVTGDNIPDGAIIIGLENIEKNTGKVTAYSSMKSISEASTMHAFSKGDVLYSKLRPYLNKVVLADCDGYCSSEIMVLKFDDMLLPEYGQLCLMSPYFVEYAMKKAYGCKMPRLGTNDGRAALMPLPPVSEQKRIIKRVNDLILLTNQLSYSL